MEKVVVIGGGVAAKGFLNAMFDFHDHVEYTVIRSNKRGPVPCGIPYAFGTLEDPNQNQSSDQAMLDHGVDLIIDDVVEINREKRFVLTKNEGKFLYDRLVMSTGSIPVFPPFEGKELKGIHVIEKDLDQVVAMKGTIEKANHIAIVGGGFIGVELADELNKMGKKVTLIELAPHILNVAFEAEISQRIERQLKDHGIEVLTGIGVEAFRGKDHVEEILLNNGDYLQADLVFMSIGAYPNVELAKVAELDLDERNAVLVNDFQQTSDPNIFAIGDCASKKDLFNNKSSNIRLASIAAKEGRVAALNLFNQKYPSHKGITNLFSTSVDGVFYAAAGMTKNICLQMAYDPIEIQVQAFNRHPAALPNTRKIQGYFFFDEKSGILLGAQLIGDKEVADMINALGMAIHNGDGALDLMLYNYGTQPLGTAAPNKYLFHQAGQKAMKEMGL